ncbi:hypothetical protein CDIK_3226, partial [Cucumispora dikerogammari]
PTLVGNSKVGEGDSFLFIGMNSTDDSSSVAATEADTLSAPADKVSAEGGGRVGGKSIPDSSGIDSATAPALAGAGESILFIGLIPTDNLLSVAATEPTLLLPTLVGNSKVGEGDSFLFIGMNSTDDSSSVAATEPAKAGEGEGRADGAGGGYYY